MTESRMRTSTSCGALPVLVYQRSSLSTTRPALRNRSKQMVPHRHEKQSETGQVKCSRIS